MHSSLLFYIACGVLFSYVKATLMHQFAEDITGIFLECLAENPVTKTDMEAMTNKQMPDNEAARCLFSCAYKNTGVMDEEGKLSADGVRKLSKKYFADDVEKMNISEEFTNACLGVNDELVEDGSKGCERAALIFKCSVSKAPKFDLI